MGMLHGHGWDEILREMWLTGVVLSGIQAGWIRWHMGGETDSSGPTLRKVINCLTFLPYANAPHYELTRRSAGKPFDPSRCVSASSAELDDHRPEVPTADNVRTLRTWRGRSNRFAADRRLV
jgi:Peptidase family S51